MNALQAVPGKRVERRAECVVNELAHCRKNDRREQMINDDK